MATISKQFDPIFAKAAAGTSIPVAYLRSLAKQESNMDPNAKGPGNERGLLQVSPVLIKAYNLAKGTSYTLDKMTDPALNAAVAVWNLQRIIESYAKNHPATLGLDWRSPRWVGLVTQGYNADEGDVSGVGKLVTRMEAQGLPADKITYQTVAQLNVVTKDNKWLSDTKRQAYVGRVVAGYFDSGEVMPSSPVMSPAGIHGINWKWLAAGGGALGLLYWLTHRDE
jgi:hypothetical protein